MCKTHNYKSMIYFSSFFKKMLFIQKITLIPENWITADVELGSNTHGREMTNYCIINMNKTSTSRLPEIQLLD